MSDILVGKVVFGERFELIEELGRGSQGITYLARELATGKDVAVKRLAVREAVDWKSVELFEREGQVLKSLNHEGIPRYVDAFHEVEGDSENPGKERFVLVQEYVAGEDLEALIGQGLRMDEEGTRDFLEQMLGILVYLHALDPAVIHRDIKPSNIMRGADGRWVLIDFGGVQVVAGDTDVGASTVVGTSGYMPFEQLMGRAVVASDLYALGATVVHLLSHRHPGDLPVDEGAHMALLFQEFVTTSPTIMELLEGMLEPLWEDRIGSAAVALGILGGDVLGDGDDGVLVHRKLKKLADRNKKYEFGVIEIEDMWVVTERSAQSLRFGVQRRGSSAREWEHEEYLIAMVVLLGIGITAMRSFFLYVMPSMGVAFGVGALCSLVVAGLYRGWRRSNRFLEVTANDVRISVGLFGLMKRRIALDRIDDICTMQKRNVYDKELGYVVEFELDGGSEIVRFGTGQTFRESEWMAGEIRKSIDGYRGIGDWEL